MNTDPVLEILAEATVEGAFRSFSPDLRLSTNLKTAKASDYRSIQKLASHSEFPEGSLRFERTPEIAQ